MSKISELKKVLGGYEYIKLYKNILKDCKSTKAMLLSAFISRSFKLSNITKTDENIWFNYSYDDIIKDLQIDLKSMKQTKRNLENEKLISKVQISDPYKENKLNSITFFKVNVNNIIKTFNLHRNDNTGVGSVDGSNAYYLVNKAVVKAVGIDRALTLINLIDKSDYYAKKHPEYNGWFFSTQKEQASDLKVHTNTIAQRLKYLENLGLLERTFVKDKRLERMVQWTRICYENIFSLMDDYEIDFGHHTSIHTFVHNKKCFVLEKPVVAPEGRSNVAPGTRSISPTPVPPEGVSNYPPEGVSNVIGGGVSNVAHIKTEDIKIVEYKKSTNVDYIPPKRRATKNNTYKTKTSDSSKPSKRTRPVKSIRNNSPKNRKMAQIKGNGLSPNSNSKESSKASKKGSSSSKDEVQKPSNGVLFTEHSKTPLKYENKENLRVFRYWNEQPNLTTHKKGTRTYQRCLDLIQALRNGVLVDKVKISEFKGNGISIDDLSRKWTPKEIRKAIKIINEQHKEGYWPDNKNVVPKSLADAIYNPRTGKSWILLVHKYGLTEVKKSKDRLSDQLKHIYNKMEFTLGKLRCQDDVSRYSEDLVKLAKNIESFYNGLAHRKIKANPHFKHVFYGAFPSAITLAEKFKTHVLHGNTDFSEYKNITPKGLDPKGNIFKIFIREWEEYLGLSFSKGGPLYEE